MARRNGHSVKYVDLFAGIGGFHLAADSVLKHGKCVLAVERDEACRAVYSNTFPDLPEKLFIREVRSLTMNGTKFATRAQIAARVPNHDLLFAGFPCQPFSKGGQQDGLMDSTQGTLFHDILLILEAKKPKLVILENVANLVGHNLGETWATVVGSLKELGYLVDHEPLIISPHQLKRSAGGAPQHRRRVYIVAVLKSAANAREVKSVDVIRHIDRPAQNHSWSIHNSGILDPVVPTRASLTKTEQLWLAAWEMFVNVIPDEKLPSFPIWVDSWFGKMKKPTQRRGSGATVRASAVSDSAADAGWWDKFNQANRAFYLRNQAALDSWVEEHHVLSFPESRRKFEWQAGSYHENRVGRTIKDCLIQLRPSGIRVKAPTYAPTLVAITQTPIVGNGKGWRRITPREAARLQGVHRFTAWKSARVKGKPLTDAQVFKQLGNAVNVKVAAFVIRRAIELAGLAK